jgi:hypothetical protein
MVLTGVSQPENVRCFAQGCIWTLPPVWAVAAGLLPAVEPGILPGGMTVPHGTRRLSGRQDAALYGSQDARRYGATEFSGRRK